ncbi:hypothetical protein Anas_09413 [Armadillidium nasatum]|uniref:Uncharacterized protein n=1 Tax=Armadillidium nasatum TaxID=96803 RepID=A0A5N5SPN6_9CRUS|nr:hypothetical protein Anas_09413 [Armadillidium nasatum]
MNKYCLILLLKILGNCILQFFFFLKNIILNVFGRVCGLQCNMRIALIKYIFPMSLDFIISKILGYK